MLIEPEDLDNRVREGDFYNRHALLASLAQEPLADRVAKALRVWRGAVLDKPSCRVSLEVVSILEETLPESDEE